MALENGSGDVDVRFNIVGVMIATGWTYEQYLQRPLWFDEFYRLKCKAEAEHQKRQSKKNEQ